MHAHKMTLCSGVCLVVAVFSLVISILPRESSFTLHVCAICGLVEKNATHRFAGWTFRSENKAIQTAVCGDLAPRIAQPCRHDWRLMKLFCPPGDSLRTNNVEQCIAAYVLSQLLTDRRFSATLAEMPDGPPTWTKLVDFWNVAPAEFHVKVGEWQLNSEQECFAHWWAGNRGMIETTLDHSVRRNAMSSARASQMRP